jgi:hypothetical protein
MVSEKPFNICCVLAQTGLLHAHIDATTGIIEISPVICPLELAARKAPNPLTEILVPFALSDAAVFHAVLAFFSSFADARSGRKTESTTTLTHRVTAISLIKESMSDVQQATSDKVLASLCYIGGSNVCRLATS